MVVAQIAPKPAATPAPAPVPAGAVVTTPFAAPREIVELSPFVVNTDKDAGFSAGVQDSYSLERYEISRGPNAALFSIGGDITKPNRVSVPVRIGQFTEPISFLFTTTLKL